MKVLLKKGFSKYLALVFAAFEAFKGALALRARRESLSSLLRGVRFCLMFNIDSNFLKGRLDGQITVIVKITRFQVLSEPYHKTPARK